jgi:pyridoxamine 5'-phosphate oxidase
MTLATVGADGRPTSRVVLLKSFDPSGFVFYTNYNSLKGKQLDKNPFAALVFWWPPLSRQVRIEGRTVRVSEAESDNYFASRPFGSQLGALASPQSEPIDRDTLDRRFESLRNDLQGKSVSRPAHWGGYRLIPDRFEFWQSGENRLHDRIAYELRAGSWNIVRLAP